MTTARLRLDSGDGACAMAGSPIFVASQAWDAVVVKSPPPPDFSCPKPDFPEPCAHLPQEVTA